jgi:hypothetical protein
MTTFDKREEGFEKKFALDEELQFKANALTGADAEAYAKAVVLADFEEAGDEDVFRKVRADLDAKGKTDITDQMLRQTMNELLAKAVAEIKDAG